ncbi:ATP-binding protein [Algoriphagus boritolerans]|uniref:AlbA family DNA-binding domain-containing protein n=1 Tax=Algoriphagus boritolerans TaxID=308111 RepID=UPI000B2765A8
MKKKAVRSFIEKHLLIPISSEVSKEEESIFYNYIQEVIWGVETLLNFPKIPDLTKLSYIYLAKLLSSIQKTAKSFYLDELANYYIFLIRIKELGIVSAIESTKPISEETIRHFPKSAKINKIYEHVEYFSKAEAKEEFIERINQISDPEEKELVEFLMAMWILQKQNAFGQKIMHRIFLTKLSIFGTEGNFQLQEDASNMTQETTTIPLKSKLNLGREDKNQEFKSSIIFTAETSSANPELQQLTILKTIAGFLNASGGNLYIGVNDEGNVVG